MNITLCLSVPLYIFTGFFSSCFGAQGIAQMYNVSLMNVRHAKDPRSPDFTNTMIPVVPSANHMSRVSLLRLVHVNYPASLVDHAGSVCCTLLRKAQNELHTSRLPLQQRIYEAG